MSDLINREAAIKMFQEKAQGYVVSMFATMTECNIAKIVAMECANELNGLPVIDAEPVRHGKWVYDPNANDWGIGGYICSECHVKNNNLPSSNVANPMIFVGTKYCPNCGAKMDLEDNNERHG